jgi:hypothetical protein
MNLTDAAPLQLWPLNRFEQWFERMALSADECRKINDLIRTRGLASEIPPGTLASVARALAAGHALGSREAITRPRTTDKAEGERRRVLNKLLRLTKPEKHGLKLCAHYLTRLLRAAAHRSRVLVTSLMLAADLFDDRAACRPWDPMGGNRRRCQKHPKWCSGEPTITGTAQVVTYSKPVRCRRAEERVSKLLQR